MREYFSPAWAECLFGLLFSATWQSSVVVALAAVGAACLRRTSARSMIWTTSIAGLAVVPVASVLLPHCFLGYQSDWEPLHFPTQMVRHAMNRTGASQFWTFTEGHWSQAVCRTLLIVWVVGVLVALGRLGWGWFEMTQLLRRARPCRDSRVMKILCRVINQPERLSVLQLDGLVGAICWQFRQAKIIVSADLEQLTDAELEMILRHEVTHIERSDPVMLFVQRLVEVVFWFHPLVWWACMQLSKYREFACDDAVIATSFHRAQYARCLGQLALGYYSPLPLTPTGLGILWNQHMVLVRVRRLLENWPDDGVLSSSKKVALYAMATTALLSTALVRIDWNSASPRGRMQWTPWPGWTAKTIDTFGLRVRDFPLDAHRYDPGEARKVDVPRGRHSAN